MPRRTRLSRAGPLLDGRRLARDAAAVLGARIRTARKRRGWSQARLGEKVDLSPSRIGQIEHGRGAGVSLEVWFALGQALDIPFRTDFVRDRMEEPLDAGHLAIQELMLRLARVTGRPRAFELATRPADPAFSIDVCVRDDIQRVLVIEECWNTFGNINASVRSTTRKIAEAQPACHRHRRRPRAVPSSGRLDRARHATQSRDPGALPRSLRHRLRWLLHPLGQGPHLTRCRASR